MEKEIEKWLDNISENKSTLKDIKNIFSKLKKFVIDDSNIKIDKAELLQLIPTQTYELPFSNYLDLIEKEKNKVKTKDGGLAQITTEQDVALKDIFKGKGPVFENNIIGINNIMLFYLYHNIDIFGNKFFGIPTLDYYKLIYGGKEYYLYSNPQYWFVKGNVKASFFKDYFKEKGIEEEVKNIYPNYFKSEDKLKEEMVSYLSQYDFINIEE